MIAIPVILGYIMTALSAAKAIQEIVGVGVGLAKEVVPIVQQAMNLMGKIQKGEQITQEELDAIQAEGDRLTAIAEAQEAQTPSA